MPSILFVFTSATVTLTGTPAGWYLPEAAHPYYILEPHFKIDFAAPLGGDPPIDPGSVETYKSDEPSVRFLNDPIVTQKLAEAKKLSDINASDYDVVFYVGGHGPAIDLAADKEVNGKLVSDFWQQGKIVSAVCHGPAALLHGLDADGNSIFKNRAVTAFSNAEESAFGTVDAIPIALETEIVNRGAKFEKASELWAAHVVVDGQLYTGQNPASASPLAEVILAAFQA
ncbi:hypothetical protein CVT24_002868 [Panaeolus cyanescens]|uniref:D-lactate dehydratase n=1 Tax=Panaeolus cyanescens TaxID=181874 RepID=A0A409YRM8_9AGAR|nr:hypothetical protein CVT24_002868 [Panaeolus cyanescens]